MLSNRWHLKDYAQKSRTGYFEWKYFNFSATDISGFFVFIAADTVGAKGARIVARVFYKNKILGGAEKFEIKSAYFSPQNISAKIGENEISVSGGNCRVRGNVSGLRFDLNYEPLSFPLAGFTGAKLDKFGLEKASWLIQSPKAKVSGKLFFEGKKIKIDGFGYDDSNWGNIFPLFARFDWGQYNDKNIAVIFGKLKNPEILGNKAVGGIFVVHKGEKIKFKPAEIEIKHLKWEFLEDGKTKVPVLSSVRGENKNYKIIFSLETKKSDALYLDFSSLFKPGIVEQTALFEGKLIKKAAKNDVLLHSFSGAGFKEYAVKKYF